MTQPRERSLDLGHLTLAARCWGPESGAPVLAVHGWQDHAGSFDLLAPLLVDALGVHLVCLDLPGHGHSDHRPPGVAYTYLDWLADVHRATLALGWDRFAFLGHSLGGSLGFAYAATWPDRVSHAASIDGFAPRLDDPADGPAWLAEHVARSDRIAARTSVRRFPDRTAAAARLVETVRGLTRKAATILADRGTRNLDDGTGAVTWRRDDRIRCGPPLRLDEAQITAFLSGVRCPALLLRPRGGLVLDAEVFARIRARCATLEIAELDGGHHVHLEHPDAVAELIGRAFESST